MSYFIRELGQFEGIVRNMFINGITDRINITTSNENDVENYSCTNIFDAESPYYWLSIANESFGQWLMMEFKDRWISLDAFSYAIQKKGRPSKILFEAYDESKSSWIDLYTNKDDILKKGFALIPITTNKTYRKFRFTNMGEALDTDNIYQFRIRALDFFGVITKCDGECGLQAPSFQYLPKICSVYSCQKSLATKISLKALAAFLFMSK